MCWEKEKNAGLQLVDRFDLLFFFIAGVFFIWGDVMSILKQGLYNWRIMKTCVAVYYGEQYYRRRKKWCDGVVVFKKKGKEKNRSAFISSSYILYTLLEVCVLVRAIEKWEHLKQNGTKWLSSPAVVCVHWKEKNTAAMLHQLLGLGKHTS